MQRLINKLFISKPSRVLGIDIGTGRLKMAQVELGKKRPLVSKCVVEELPLELINNGYVRNFESMITFVKEMVAKNELQAKYVVFTVGGRSAFVREIDMPEMPYAEMKEAVAWDSGQYVPYEAETYYVDAAKFGSLNDEGLQPVLLVASPKEVIDTMMVICDALKWKPLAIEIEVLAVYRTLIEQYSDFVMLDIGRSYSMLTIFQSGAPVAQRSIPQSGQMFDAAIAQSANVTLRQAEALKIEENLLGSDLEFDRSKYAEFFNEIENLGREVKRTCEYYKINKKEARFTHLILVGGGAAMLGLPKFLSNNVEMEVVMHDLRGTIDFSSKMDEKDITANLGALTVAVGAALAGGEADA